MTNKKIPPCPVCGVAPAMSYSLGSMYSIRPTCEHLSEWLQFEPLVLLRQWRWACNNALAESIRSHGIETVAQVDALVVCTREMFDLAGDAVKAKSPELYAIMKSIKEGEK